MTRLVIHIGVHKTASTAIQHFFCRNRLLLWALGIYYPRAWSPRRTRLSKHNDLVHAALKMKRTGAAHPHYGPPGTVVARYLHKIARSRARVAVISAESFFSHGQLLAETLRPFRDHFDVRVVCFVRRQDFWLESFYRWIVVSRMDQRRDRRDFRQFLDDWRKRGYFDYAQALRPWADAFGAENVVAVPFEPAVDGFAPMTAFLEAAEIDIPAFGALPYRDVRRNLGAPREAVEVIRRLNEMGVALSKRQIGRVARRFANGEMSYLGDDDRAEILARVERSNQRAAALFVRDGREALFPVVPERFRPAARTWTGLEDAATFDRAVRLLGLKLDP